MQRTKPRNDFIPQGSIWVTFVSSSTELRKDKLAPIVRRKLGTDEDFDTARKKNVRNLSENENCKERKKTIIS